jgi:transcriptional regulator with XRE-family HTH domain
MERRGLNGAQLAVKAGIARETISKFTNDKRGIGPTSAAKLAAALGVTPDEVLRRAEDAATRHDLDSRLRSLEAEVGMWQGMLLEALALLDLQADPAADQGARVQRATGQGTRAAGRRR